MKRIVVLASGSGSNLQALIDAVRVGELQATIAGVISDRPGAGALQRAEQAGIPAVTVPLSDRRSVAARAGFEQRLMADHRQTAHFLDVASGVGDDPMPRHQLRGDVAAVLDGHRVGKGEWPVRQLRLFGQELRLHAAGKSRSTHAPAL